MKMLLGLAAEFELDHVRSVAHEVKVLARILSVKGTEVRAIGVEC
ncbi:hypothetical protein OK016_15885 [Vibrio chagasii]|nr:hypothetical protein [Vibrio chagasii]